MFALAQLGTQGVALCAASAAIQWIGVSNDLAGRFEAQRVADELEERLGSAITIYQTVPDPRQRVADLEALIKDKAPSSSRPLGILVLGGDGTINDSLTAIIRHLFIDTRYLLGRPPDRLVDQMLESGIRLGAVRLGGANDIGTLYGVAEGNVDDILDYLTEARLMALNMGLALIDNDRIKLFSQTVAAGTTIASVFEKTRDERGHRAKRHQQILGARNILFPKPFKIRWRDADGTAREEMALEIVSHASLRGAETNAFPGTPQPGLGIKVFPSVGLWKRIRLVAELYASARAISKGDLGRLLPDQSMRRLDASFQLSLEPGGEIGFSFYTADDQASKVPSQGNGDFVGLTHSLRVHALPPFPSFMGRDDSPMANLQNRLANPS